MAIHWSFKSLPEVRELTKAERKECSKFCFKRAQSGWRYWLIFVVLIPMCFAGAAIGKALLGRPVGSILGGALGGGIGGILIAPILTFAMRPHLDEWKQLRRHAPGRSSTR